MTTGCAYLAKGALESASEGEAGNSRVSVARYFAENLVGETASLKQVVTDGADALLSVDSDMLDSA